MATENERTSTTNGNERVMTETLAQREALADYKRVYLPVPAIEDRKPVFLSKETRDRLDRIVRLFGERKMSVSGLTENIVRRHLDVYEKDIDEWRKL